MKCVQKKLFSLLTLFIFLFSFEIIQAAFNQKATWIGVIQPPPSSPNRLNVKGQLFSIEGLPINGIQVKVKDIDFVYLFGSPLYGHANFDLTFPFDTQLSDSLVTVRGILSGGNLGQPAFTILNPSLAPAPESLTALVGGAFHIIGQDILQNLVNAGGLTPSSKVFDVGCGCGRATHYLAYYLNEKGRYDGFEVTKVLFNYVKNDLKPRLPKNFNFKFVDVYNSMYNPQGTVKASQIRFPYENSQFDFAFATSIFTHMVADDVKQYLKEIHRVLEPGGRFVFTCFGINPAVRDRINKGKAIHSFTYKIGDCYVGLPSSPDTITAYDDSKLLEWLQSIGFTVNFVYPGNWSGGGTVLSGQDWWVVTKN